VVQVKLIYWQKTKQNTATFMAKSPVNAIT